MVFSSKIGKKMFEEDDLPEDGDVYGLHELRSKSTLEEPGLVSFWKDYKNRVLRVEFPCVRDFLNETAKSIINFNREDEGVPKEERKPIKLFVHSEGGALEDVLAFVDIASLSVTPIWTYNIGYAWSGGFVLLLLGEKRFTLKNSTALLHQGSMSGGGEQTYGQIQEDAKNYAKRMKVMEDFVLSRTKITKQLYGQKRRTEWYMSAEEQVKYGVVDKIIESIDELF